MFTVWINIFLREAGEGNDVEWVSSLAAWGCRACVCVVPGCDRQAWEATRRPRCYQYYFYIFSLFFYGKTDVFFICAEGRRELSMASRLIPQLPGLLYSRTSKCVANCSGTRNFLVRPSNLGTKTIR